MKNKFKILIIIVLLVICCGCGYTREEKKEFKRIEIQAKENAINYIKNKYGIDAKVKSVSAEKEDTGPIINFTPGPTGYAFVLMKSNDRKFTVYISGEEKTLEGKDNYQYPETSRDLVDSISSKVGMTPVSYYVDYGNIYPYIGLSNKKYDGVDIIGFATERYTDVVLDYVKSGNFSYAYASNVLSDYSMGKILLINYNSEESYKKLKKQLYTKIQGTFEEYQIERLLEENPGDIKSIYYLNWGKTYYYEK